MKKDNIWFRIVIAALIVVFLVLFFKNFTIVPKKNANSQKNLKEELIYSYKNSYYVETIVNTLGEEVKPKEEEKILCVQFSVKNAGEKTIFYVSIVEDPAITTEENNVYSPDLSISNEPFGDLGVSEVKEGFLAFRIPKDEKPKTFRIGNYSVDIKNLD